MAYLNINIPVMECLVREEFLRDMTQPPGYYHECVVFGMASIPGQAPLFHCLMADGGLFWRLPIHAFCWKECEPLELSELVMWDSFSSHASSTVFSLIQNKRMKYLGRDKVWREGSYLFTLDWSHSDPNCTDTGFSEVPGQHKSGHVMKLDSGHYAIQPNNRVRVFDPSFVTKPGEMVCERLLHTHLWSAEQTVKWVLGDNEQYEYSVLENGRQELASRAVLPPVPGDFAAAADEYYRSHPDAGPGEFRRVWDWAGRWTDGKQRSAVKEETKACLPPEGFVEVSHG